MKLLRPNCFDILVTFQKFKIQSLIVIETVYIYNISNIYFFSLRMNAIIQRHFDL